MRMMQNQNIGGMQGPQGMGMGMGAQQGIQSPPMGFGMPQAQGQFGMPMPQGQTVGKWVEKNGK